MPQLLKGLLQVCCAGQVEASTCFEEEAEEEKSVTHTEQELYLKK